MEVRVFVSPSGFADPSSTRWSERVWATDRRPSAVTRARDEAAAYQRPDGTGRNDFLYLLTTQLKYQDPLSPIQDHEFIAQLAQFSTLEELQGLNRRLDDMVQLQLWVSGMGQATSLIGRTVTLDLPDGTTVTGTVTGVRMREGVPYLQVGGQEYIVTMVSRVT